MSEDEERRKYMNEVREALARNTERSKESAAQVAELYSDMYGSKDSPGGYIFKTSARLKDVEGRVTEIEDVRRVAPKALDWRMLSIAMITLLILTAIILNSTLGQTTDIQDLPRLPTLDS